MADDGRPELPKPPRRIPSWAVETASRTSIQAPTPPPRPTPPAPPAPPRWRFRFVVPLILFVLVLVLGAGAGWLIRAQSRTLDSTKVLQNAGPSVVRVLATTCNGTGQATGIRLGDALVLTAASAVRGPVSVALETADGLVRRAIVLGTSTDGVAVLRVIGQLVGQPADLAAEQPDPKAHRAILGYSPEGNQLIRSAGTAEAPKQLRDIIGETSLGAPVFDNNGQVVGLVTGDTVATGKVLALPDLRQYTGSRPPIAPEPPGVCQAKGPQNPLVPTLAVANTPLAGEVLQTLSAYLNALNKHDFVAMQATYTKELAASNDLAADTARHKTSYAFGATITQVTPSGNTGAFARMSFTVLFSADGQGSRGQTCSRLDIRYFLVRQEGRLRIRTPEAMPGNQSCDTD
jgi:hypothetical protein